MKYTTQRMNFNMPHNMSETFREGQITTIIKFKVKTKNFE